MYIKWLNVLRLFILVYLHMSTTTNQHEYLPAVSISASWDMLSIFMITDILDIRLWDAPNRRLLELNVPD